LFPHPPENAEAQYTVGYNATTDRKKGNPMKSVIFGTERIIPSKIVCVGRNYVEHIRELGNEIPETMVLFNKPNSAITDTLEYFGPYTRFEGEICLIVEKNRIAGIGFGLDLTHARIQEHLKNKGLPWERAKAFDGSAVLSDFIPYSGNISRLRFELLRNRSVAQRADYSLMIHKPGEILAEILGFMTLEDGDIIMTGTPKGVSAYGKGDVFEAKLFEEDRPLLETK